MAKSQEAHTVGKISIDSVRTKLIETARDGWISCLIDLSRRNNLLFYRPVPTSSIQVSSGSTGLTDLLAGKAVAAQSLLADAQDRPSRVLAIARKATENKEEKGLETLYLALGFATWTASDGGRDPRAPIYLIPLEIRRKAKDTTAIEVQIAGDAQINPVLVHVLDDEFGIQVPETEMCDVVAPEDLDLLEDAPEGSMAERYAIGIQLLQDRLAKIPGSKTDISAVISNFSFAKLALVSDLKVAGALLTENGAVAAIAGDEEARNRLGSSQIEVDPHSLDSRAPQHEFCVVEADSSQQCAIAGIAAGQNAVVHGPPGTGKSQTITNLIATLCANGKKVLFVAEKRAALEVVIQRLESCGLDHLAMDLHGAELSPKKVMERISRTLSVVKDSKRVEAQDSHRQFEDRRSKLNAHEAQMHTMSERCGKTLYDIQGSLLRLPAEAKTSIRWRGAELAQIAPSKAEQVRDLLREAMPFERLFMRDDPSPWTGVIFRSGKDVQTAIDLAQRLAHETLPLLEAKLEELRSIGFDPPRELAFVELAVDCIGSVGKWLSLYEVAVFSSDLLSLLHDLIRVKDGGVRALWLLPGGALNDA